MSDPGDLQPGDLVFFAYDLTDPGTIHHVGIYIGAGNMIDAPHQGAVVTMRPAITRGDYIGAVRPTAGLAETAPTTTTTPGAGANPGQR